MQSWPALNPLAIKVPCEVIFEVSKLKLQIPTIALYLCLLRVKKTFSWHACNTITYFSLPIVFIKLLQLNTILFTGSPLKTPCSYNTLVNYTLFPILYTNMDSVKENVHLCHRNSLPLLPSSALWQGAWSGTGCSSGLHLLCRGHGAPPTTEEGMALS